VHVFQFRRPAMSFLSALWEYTSSKGWQPGLEIATRRLPGSTAAVTYFFVGWNHGGDHGI